ncbi:MAG: two-component system response regulator [Deltaproteobacteria bacterium]
MESMPQAVLILIATPHRFLLTDYRAALQKQGFEVVTAADGVECLRLLRSRIPNLIVLDCDILWGGAEGVLDLLAADPTYPTIPAMIIGSRQSRSALYRAGRYIASDYQLKPLTSDRLVRRISDLLKSGWQTAADIREGAAWEPFRSAGTQVLIGSESPGPRSSG